LNGLDYTDDEIEKIVNDIYGGSISREVLPVGLYNDIRERLNKGVFEGFGGSYADFDTSTADGLIMAGFERNIAVFSGAKTFQQVNDMSNFLFAGAEKIPFGEFKKHATEIFDTYNKNWLNTEYNTAISQAMAGRQWFEVTGQKDIFPLLKYETVGDERVRNSHKELDGVVFEVGDDFWNNYFPPNDWNCRCITEQLEEGDEPLTSPAKKFTPNPELFQMNAGKDKVIFREDVHPYFKVADRYAVALNGNFELPFVPQVKPAPAVPVVKPKVPRKPRAPKVVVPELVPAVPEVVPATELTAKLAGEKILNLETVKEASALSDEIDAMRKLSNERVTELNKINYREDGDIYREKLSVYNEDLKIRKALERKKERLMSKAELEIIDILKVEDNFKNLSITKVYGTNEDKFQHLKPKIEQFKTMFSNKWQPAKTEVSVSIKGKVRASFNQVFNRVTLAPTDGIETIFHEFGHFMEHSNPELHSKIMAFYERRTANDSLERLSSVTGNRGYRPDEVTKKDNFLEAYIGKYYGRQGSSEILTMWFTEVFTNPTRLIQKDFDYFETMFNLIREK